MKRTSLQALTLLLAVAIFSCSSPKKSEETTGEEKVEEAAKDLGPKKYTVYKAPASYEYPDASLEMIEPSSPLDTSETTFKFEVTNYELGIQTPDAVARGIANSGKGQHIHFILNNDPYSAHYEPEFTKSLPEGKHVILAFLSRSYHEAVKNSSSYILKELVVGSPDESTPSFDESAQHLFYSRPKGTYSGTDTEKLMLDFFLFNTSISPDGNKVRATINGEEHMITEWAPYYIEGLEKGQVSIKLELIDKDGNNIPGPYNTVERMVTLAE